MRALALFLLLPICHAFAVGEDKKSVAGEWSAPAKGLRGRLLFGEDPPFNGTRMAVIYLELQNVSDVGNPLEIYLHTTPAPIRCDLLDATGKPVPQGSAPASIKSPPPYWLALPHDSTLRFRVSVSGYGIPKDAGLAIQLESGFWLIPGDARGDFFLSASFSATNPKDQRRAHAWEGTLDLPRLKISTNAQ